jgi:hypothetical protein
VRLAVSGARVEAMAYGAQLVLEKSGRRIAYSRLRATDATGKELTARIQVCQKTDPTAMATNTDPESKIKNQKSRIANLMTVTVNDTGAVYPVRIDPTFSDANWISMGGIPGADGQVNAVVLDSSGDLYIGGYFTAVGNVVATSVAEWNGSAWSALGSGTGGGGVYALAVSGSNVYAGGGFKMAGGNTVNYIAKWDGVAWSALGSGMGGVASPYPLNPGVYALAVSNNTVYAGGNFTTADGNPANCIAKWDGSSWSGLGSGMNSYVVALALSASGVYAGGYFTNAGTISANFVAQWDGTAWTALGTGVDAGPNPGQYYPTVHALAVSGSVLYAGGYFTSAGGIPATNIARWDGSTWTALSPGMAYSDYVYALAVSGSDLYAGGLFSIGSVAKWNGSTWSGLGTGGAVYALAVSGTNVYAGGDFDIADGSIANYFAKWDGRAWTVPGASSTPGTWLNSYVYALAVFGSNVFVGGPTVGMTTGYGDPLHQWDGSTWSRLGVNGPVFALAASGSNLYVGGYFTYADGIAPTNIAKWDGNTWSPLGSGMNSNVLAIAVSGSNLYAGGYFTKAGGSAANYVAKWDGSSWSALGSGIGGVSNPVVYALAVSGGDLYVGGDFGTAGGIAATNVAKWDGSAWSALGSGLGVVSNYLSIYNGSPVVRVLATSGSDLYAGGGFTNAGASAVNYIAKWDGSTWSSLGSGVGDTVSNYGYVQRSVFSLAVSGSNLYVGGSFTTAGGSPANSIAQWDGTAWSALGSGVRAGPYSGVIYPTVHALLVSGGYLYAGGDFTTTGDKVSAYIAEAYLVAPPGGIVDSIVTPSSGVANVKFYGNPGQQFGVQRATNLSPPGWTTVSSSPLNPAADGSITFVDTNAPIPTAYYRVLQY